VINRRKGVVGSAPTTPPDLTLSEALAAAAELWAAAVNGVFVGRDGARFMVGFIREDKRAVRFVAPTLRLALERGRQWMRSHPDMEHWAGPGYPDRWKPEEGPCNA